MSRTLLDRGVESPVRVPQLLETTARVLYSSAFWDIVSRTNLALTCQAMRPLVAERVVSITVDPAGGYAIPAHFAGFVDRIRVMDTRNVSDLDIDALARAVNGLRGAPDSTKKRSYKVR